MKPSTVHLVSRTNTATPQHRPPHTENTEPAKPQPYNSPAPPTLRTWRNWQNGKMAELAELAELANVERETLRARALRLALSIGYWTLTNEMAHNRRGV